MEIPSLAIDIQQFRKTRRGWLGNKVKQIHLRDDIECGFQYCNEHSSQSKSGVFKHDPSAQDNIFFVDSEILEQQTDILYNCLEINNLVILQSQLQMLKKKNINKYNAFKNFIEAEDLGEGPSASQAMEEENQEDIKLENTKRNFYVFADVYHKAIQLETRSQKNQLNPQKSLQSSIKWYSGHIKDIGLLNLNVVFLTIKSWQNSKTLRSISLIEFLKDQNSNLLDFIGFAEIQTQMDQEPLFDEHIDQKQARKKVKEGKIFEGKYMNSKSYIKVGKNIKKITLQNNRAIFGDVVAIEISPFETWNKTAKIIQEQGEQIEANNIKVYQDQMKDQSVSKLLKLMEQNPHLTPRGRVVSILKRNTKDFCGSVDTENAIQQYKNGWTMFEFKPADDKFPSFYIRTFNKNIIAGKRIQVSLDNWPVNSSYPLCHFLRVIGNIGDVRAEGDVILLEHNVEIREFSRKAYECLPKAGQQFSIPKEQEQYRLDLRHIDVVSIDPPGCKDIDDALHCIQLQNGNLEIGVHIADVSYYVRPDSALDMQARNRCTTVYLVNRRTDMLPKLLTQNLCSLRSNVDRLAFSTIWQIDQKANIVKTKYCKSIIRSRRAFTYMEAQQLMDSDSTSNIAKSIRNLNKIAKLTKQKRLDNGALTLASTQVKITLAQQTHSATDVQMYQMVETNYLIEEFMLLANISVAQKIYQRFPALSILRRHTPPKVSQLQILKQTLSLYGFNMTFDTSKALADSLNEITKKDDPFFNKLVRILTTRCMNQATYFCSADFDPQEFFHYGLAAQFYTHFTSPIRRYADVLVHRLLAAAIDLEPLPNFMTNKLKMTKICDKMNMRNRMARYASRASSDYHTYQFFKDRQNAVEEAIIVNIVEKQISVLLVKYGLECKVELSEEQTQQTIELNKNKQKGNMIFNMCMIKGKKRDLFGYVDVNVEVHMEGFHKKVIVNIL